MHMAKWKEPVWKGYLVCHPSDRTFWKRQSHRDENRWVAGLPRLWGWGWGWAGSIGETEIFRAMKVLWMIQRCIDDMVRLLPCLYATARRMSLNISYGKITYRSWLMLCHTHALFICTTLTTGEPPCLGIPPLSARCFFFFKLKTILNNKVY